MYRERYHIQMYIIRMYIWGHCRILMFLSPTVALPISAAEDVDVVGSAEASWQSWKVSEPEVAPSWLRVSLRPGILLFEGLRL